MPNYNVLHFWLTLNFESSHLWSCINGLQRVPRQRVPEAYGPIRSSSAWGQYPVLVGGPGYGLDRRLVLIMTLDGCLCWWTPNQQLKVETAHIIFKNCYQRVHHLNSILQAKHAIILCGDTDRQTDIPCCHSLPRPAAGDRETTSARTPRGCGRGTCVQVGQGYDGPTAVCWGPGSLSKECPRSTRGSSLGPCDRQDYTSSSPQLRPRSGRDRIGYQRQGIGPEWMNVGGKLNSQTTSLVFECVIYTM